MLDRIREYQGEDQLDLFSSEQRGKWALKVALSVIVVVVMALFATATLAEPTTLVRAAFCDKPEQMVEAITTNVLPAKVGDVSPCVYGAAVTIIGKKVDEVTKDGKLWDIMEVLMLAVHDGKQFVRVVPTIQYIALENTDAPA